LQPDNSSFHTKVAVSLRLITPLRVAVSSPTGIRMNSSIISLAMISLTTLINTPFDNNKKL
jgi:hypothetical protein